MPQGSGMMHPSLSSLPQYADILHEIWSDRSAHLCFSFCFAMHTALFSKAPQVRLHAACRNYLSVSTKGNAAKVKLTLCCMVLQ